MLGNVDRHSKIPMESAPQEIIFESGLPFEDTCPKCEQDNVMHFNSDNPMWLIVSGDAFEKCGHHSTGLQLCGRLNLTVSMALRLPVKAPCGHFYCTVCMDVSQSPSNCLVCQAEIPVNGVVLDKEKQKEIHNLAVKCTYSDQGCEWRGILKELKAHLTTCEYQARECPTCNEFIAKNDFAAHLAKCDAATVHCEYCQAVVRTSTFKKHLEQCGKVIVSCPFLCGLTDVPREKLDEHRPYCQNVNNVCPFNEFGCTFIGDKSAVQHHLSEEPVRHLVYLCDGATIIKKAHDAAQKQFSKALDEQKELIVKAENCEKMYGPQLIWRIDDITVKMNEAKSGARPTILSEPFMSGRHGYKMIAAASLFGDGMSRGEYISVYVAILRGEYDAILQWPFKEVVKISMLDPNPDVRERTDVVFTVDTRTLSESSHFLSRPDSDRNASFGAQTFCRLNKLPHYIENDAIFLRFEINPPAEFVLPQSTQNAFHVEAFIEDETDF